MTDFPRTLTALRQPLGYFQLTLTSTAAKLFASFPKLPPGVTVGFIIIQCSTADSRWRDDGQAPTTTVGMNLIATGELDYAGDPYKIQFIAVSGSPVLDVSLYT